MKTSDREFDARVAELERMFQSRTDDAAQHDQKNISREPMDRRSGESRKPRLVSVLCALSVGVFLASLAGINYAPRSNPNPWIPAPSPEYSNWLPGVDQHTIEGTATIHKNMQSGTVNVSKSTITGIVDSQSMTASLYWTFVLKNNNSSDKEAAITMDLPTNSALSRATLWINGVAQEAAFSSNSQVQNAYDSIVVRHRDPLLVTQIGPNKIKILAAPVTANGGEMQFRIGLTVPAQRDTDGRSFVSLPHITESNLKFDSKQDVHLTSSTEISGIGTTEHSGIYVLKANTPVNEMEQVKIKMSSLLATNFATRLTHTSPAEYVQASVEGGQLVVSRVKEKPAGKFINEEDVASRLSNLWAHQQIEIAAAKGNINEACNLANVYRIVSSVSGATVLEQNFDYSNNGLNRDMYRTLGRSSSTGADFTQVKGFVPYSATGAQTQFGGAAAPMLQGATNGTIGPQGADATVIQGVNTAGTVRVNNLANLEALLNIISNLLESVGIMLAVFLLSESVFNKGLGGPIRLSPQKTCLLALIIGLAGLYTPNAINAAVAWMRDLNLFC